MNGRASDETFFAYDTNGYKGDGWPVFPNNTGFVFHCFFFKSSELELLSTKALTEATFKGIWIWIASSPWDTFCLIVPYFPHMFSFGETRSTLAHAHLISFVLFLSYTRFRYGKFLGGGRSSNRWRERAMMPSMNQRCEPFSLREIERFFKSTCCIFWFVQKIGSKKRLVGVITMRAFCFFLLFFFFSYFLWMNPPADLCCCCCCYWADTDQLL